MVAIPPGGRILVADWCRNALKIVEQSRAPVERVGFSPRSEARITRLRATRRGMTFELGGERFLVPVFGRMNAMNAAMASLASALKRGGTPVHLLRSIHRLPQFISRVWEPGDVLFCSLMPGCDFITIPLAEKIRALAHA